MVKTKRRCTYCKRRFIAVGNGRYCSGQCPIMRSRGEPAWTRDEDYIIELEFPTCEFVNDLARQMGRSAHRIAIRAKIIGVERSDYLKHKAQTTGGRKNKGNLRPDLSERNRIEVHRGSDNHFFGKKHTAECRARMSAIAKEVTQLNKLNKDPEFQAKRLAALREKHKDPEYTRRRMRAIHNTRGGPNFAERRLDEIIQKTYSDEYKFTGDGSVLIGGLNPDWTNVNGRKALIELFGEHVHDPEQSFIKVPERGTYSGRKKAYAEYGFKCLIIWCSELKDEQLVIRRLKRFHENLCD